MRGLIFNIQKFSLHDGPGIRTVVFMKGCPLRCEWCSNPESWRREPDRMDGEAIGAWRTVDDVLRVCQQDEPFYRQSGGGVTLSGGEVLLQPEFAVALLDRLHEKQIHAALETAGHAAADVFAQVCSRADLLLFDLKHWDTRRHMEGTGVGNELILANLRRAIEMGVEVLVRIPVIPDYNDSPSDAAAFAAHILAAGASRTQLLPFHQFGEKKHASLGRTYRYADVRALHEEALSDYLETFAAAGISAFI